MAAADRGTLLDAGGYFRITWDHDHGGLLQYTIEEAGGGATYLAHYDGGWRVRPGYMPTVDMERLLDPSDPDFMDLVDALNRASGRAPVPGVHTW